MPRVSRTVALLLLLHLLVPPSLTAAETLICLLICPISSIAEGLLTVGLDGVIYILAGTYNEVNSSTLTKNITINALNGTVTVNGPGLWLTAEAGLTLLGSFILNNAAIKSLGGTLNMSGSTTIHYNATSLQPHALSFQGGSFLQVGPVNISLDGGLVSKAAAINFEGTSALWNQTHNLTVKAVGSDIVGIILASADMIWDQKSLVRLDIGGDIGVGVSFQASNILWLQVGSLQVSVGSSASCGINLTTSGFGAWQQLGPTFDIVTCPLAPPIPFLLSRIDLGGQKPSFTFASFGVELKFLALAEAGGLSSSISLQEVGWTQTEATTQGLTLSTGESANATLTSMLPNNATLTYEFFTYAEPLVLTLSNGFEFPQSPAFLKFSLVLDNWKWSSLNGSLQLQLSVNPPFTSFEKWPNTPKNNMTTLLLTQPGQTSTLVRLLDFGLAGSQWVACNIEVSDPVNSTIVLTFDHFSGTLVYDPDVAVLMGQSSNGGFAGWKIAVIVVVTVSVIVVVALGIAVAIASYTTHWRYKKNFKTNVVNFNGEEEKTT